MLLVEVREHLGVACGVQPMSVLEKPAPKVRKVVQLAVLRRPDRAGLVRERLTSTLDVDDAQTAGAEREVRSSNAQLIVWPSMSQRREHACDDLGIAEAENTADTAHGLCLAAYVGRSRPERHVGTWLDALVNGRSRMRRMDRKRRIEHARFNGSGVRIDKIRGDRP